MTKDTTVKLRVPKQDLDQTRFFASDQGAVAQWVADLPLANLGQTTKLLYQALQELNRCRLLPEKRYALLEELRRTVYFVSGALAKHYYNKPVILPNQAQQVAKLVYNLHHLLASGYTIVAAHTAALGKQAGKKPQQLIGRALHRCFAENSMLLQLMLELYQNPDEQHWQSIYQFYLLAQQQGVLEQTVHDPELGLCTVEQSYLRSLLLCCSRCNQLRQDDIRTLCKLLTEWVKFCHLSSDNSDCIYVLNHHGSHNPVYREFVEDMVDSHWLGLDFKPLCQQLQKILDEHAGSSQIQLHQQTVSRDLLQQLLQAWSRLSKRSAIRVEESGVLDICIGISAIHHFISDGMDFAAFVYQQGDSTLAMAENNPFLKVRGRDARQKDVWDSPYEANLGKLDVALDAIDYPPAKQKQLSENVKYQCHQVDIINSSAQGYCVEWPNDIPSQFRAGEIVGLRERNSHNWHIAEIRWVGKSTGQQDEEEAVHLGLQLISPTAAPYAARIVNRSGAPGEYMRVLVLPPVPTINRPVTLLTARLPFQVKQKVDMNQYGRVNQAKLLDRLNQSGNYNMFSFHVAQNKLDKPDDDDDRSAPGDEFDSLWNNL